MAKKDDDARYKQRLQKTCTARMKEKYEKTWEEKSSLLNGIFEEGKKVPYKQMVGKFRSVDSRLVTAITKSTKCEAPKIKKLMKEIAVIGKELENKPLPKKTPKKSKSQPKTKQKKQEAKKNEEDAKQEEPQTNDDVKGSNTEKNEDNDKNKVATDKVEEEKEKEATNVATQVEEVKEEIKAEEENKYKDIPEDVAKIIILEEFFVPKMVKQKVKKSKDAGNDGATVKANKEKLESNLIAMFAALKEVVKDTPYKQLMPKLKFGDAMVMYDIKQKTKKTAKPFTAENLKHWMNQIGVVGTRKPPKGPDYSVLKK